MKARALASGSVAAAPIAPLAIANAATARPATAGHTSAADAIARCNGCIQSLYSVVEALAVTSGAVAAAPIVLLAIAITVTVRPAIAGHPSAADAIARRGGCSQCGQRVIEARALARGSVAAAPIVPLAIANAATARPAIASHTSAANAIARRDGCIQR